MSFLKTNYKMLESLSDFTVIILKHQETLEPNFDQKQQVLVKASIRYALDRIWSLAREKIFPGQEYMCLALQKTWQYTYSFGETYQINRKIIVFIINIQTGFVCYSVCHH